MRKLLQVAAITVLTVSLFGCATKKAVKTTVRSEHNIDANIISVGNDGTKLIKSWGYGKKPETAVIDAKRKAVEAAIFKGFTAGGGSAKVGAIVKNTNAKAENKAFFDEFLKTGGKYLQYVDSKDYGIPSGANRIKIKTGYKVAVSVAIEFDSLRKYLEEKGIARKLDAGF
ncbi:MAG: hypothetical protein U9R54_02965 [Bacteroidota bacterium]|nr:hypothetical protein [Bacteroidota bacterium]